MYRYKSRRGNQVAGGAACEPQARVQALSRDGPAIAQQNVEEAGQSKALRRWSNEVWAYFAWVTKKTGSNRQGFGPFLIWISAEFWGEH